METIDKLIAMPLYAQIQVFGYGVGIIISIFAIMKVVKEDDPEEIDAVFSMSEEGEIDIVIAGVDNYKFHIDSYV